MRDPADAEGDQPDRVARRDAESRRDDVVAFVASLSIMFLSGESAMSSRTSGSTHVVQNVARFWRELRCVS